MSHIIITCTHTISAPNQTLSCYFSVPHVSLTYFSVPWGKGQRQRLVAYYPQLQAQGRAPGLQSTNICWVYKEHMYKQWNIREINKDRSKWRRNMIKEQEGTFWEWGETEGRRTVGRQLFFASLEETGLWNWWPERIAKWREGTAPIRVVREKCKMWR